MSNHFPTIPTLNLASVTYQASWNGNQVNFQDLSYFNVTGVNAVQGEFLCDQYGDLSANFLVVPFVFSTPGSAGSFDQDAEEAKITTLLNDIAQALATATGNTLATVQGWITVQRMWAWQDSSVNYTLSYQSDTMTYP